LKGDLNMSTGVTRLLTVVTVLGVAAAFAALAFAHDPPRVDQRSQGSMTGTDSQLSPEQIQELEQAREAYREKAVPLERELDAKWSELETLTSEPGADLDQVTALRRQVRKLERELEDLRFEADVQVSRMLSPEQRDYFGHTGDLLAGHDRWSCDDGCRGQGHHSRNIGSDRSRWGHCW
jgi:Spy/CpxP family protein refolding chaperone